MEGYDGGESCKRGLMEGALQPVEWLRIETERKSLKLTEHRLNSLKYPGERPVARGSGLG
jgi:hypothetical protein